MAEPVSRGDAQREAAKEQERDPRLGYGLAGEALRDGRTVRVKLSCDRGYVEGTVISQEDAYCLLDISGIGGVEPSRRVYWAELDGFEILPGDVDPPSPLSGDSIREKLLDEEAAPEHSKGGLEAVVSEACKDGRHTDCVRWVCAARCTCACHHSAVTSPQPNQGDQEGSGQGGEGR